LGSYLRSAPQNNGKSRIQDCGATPRSWRATTIVPFYVGISILLRGNEKLELDTMIMDWHHDYGQAPLL